MRHTLLDIHVWSCSLCHPLLVPVDCSFAIVIQQLPNPLRDAIAIFYLVLRGLDTVEDDMAIPEAEKIPQLLSFHKDIYNKWVMGCLKFEDTIISCTVLLITSDLINCVNSQLLVVRCIELPNFE